MIVGFAAGGISDVLGRAVAITASKQLGQQVVVENKPGAGTTIAGDYIARSSPDGYTIWLQDITTHAINAALYAKLPYDSVKDFTYVAMIASTPLMLVVHPSTNAHSVPELIALLKANPGKLSYGSSGNGTIVHLAGEMLRQAAGVEVLHVPYKGSNPATQAILGGEVTFVFSTMPPAISAAKAGKLRALAVTTPKRVAATPEVPTMIESGLREFDVVLYSGVLGPKGTDAAVVEKLNAAFAATVRAQEIQKVYEQLGAEAIVMSPQAFEAATQREIAKLAPLVKASGAKVD
ncbi:MAG: tripartite tricarboxylate transporter substrate binding protein [Betaproteobacteria bacterium]|nr:MAG: tripartite tricarboxylate transporter substrate binding protein [Betaproteobacteria bacterium]